MDKLPPDVLHEIWKLIPYEDIKSFGLTSHSTYLVGISRIKEHTRLRKEYETLVVQVDSRTASDVADFLDHVIERPEIAQITKQLVWSNFLFNGSLEWSRRVDRWDFLSCYFRSSSCRLGSRTKARVSFDIGRVH